MEQLAFIVLPVLLVLIFVREDERKGPKLTQEEYEWIDSLTTQLIQAAESTDSELSVRYVTHLAQSSEMQSIMSVNTSDPKRCYDFFRTYTIVISETTGRARLTELVLARLRERGYEIL